MRGAINMMCLLLPAVFATPLTVHAPVSVSGKSHLPYLFDHYYQAFQLNDPSGAYSGSKTVLGQDIQISATFSDGVMAFDVSGALSVACDTEAYSYSDPTITVTNIGTSGDCLHDALDAASASLESLTYSPSSDEVVVSLKYSILSITITLTHSARLPVVLPSNPLALSTMVEKYSSLSALDDPAGTYYGEKKILGEDIKATLVIVSATEFNLALGGAVSIECDNEAYTLSGGEINVTNKDKTGDCIHDDLKDNSITLESVKYDASSDHITVTVKYTIITISIELDHQSVQQLRQTHSMASPAKESTALSLPTLVDRYYSVYALNAPDGKYEGVKSVLGQKVDTTVSVSGTSLAFTVSGVISIECDAEAFSYSNGVISITDIGKSGDCVHDALSSNHCTLQSMTYDTATDEIQVKIKYAVITISLDLKHQSKNSRAIARVENLPPNTLEFLYNNYFSVFLKQNPSGTYEGKKTILGVAIDTKAVSREADFDLSISGPVSIECDKNAYTYANGVVTATNVGTPGDCLHDALADNNVTLESITYDETADHMTINIKYSFLKVSLELDKVALRA